MSDAFLNFISAFDFPQAIRYKYWWRGKMWGWKQSKTSWKLQPFYNKSNPFYFIARSFW